MLIKGMHASPRHSQTTRRSVIRGGLLGSAGLAAAALFGCKTAAPTKAPGVSVPAAGGTAKPKILNEALLALNDTGSKYPFVVPEPDLAPKKGGILKHAWLYDIASMDPTASTSNSTLGIANAVGDRLIDRAHGAQFNPLRTDLVPGLALSWELAPDGLTYTFKMTDKAKFHNKPPVNGRTMTAQDVKTVYERYRSTGVSRAYFSNADTITVVNPTTITIKLKKPQPDFLVPLAARELVTYAPEMVDAGLLKNNIDSIGTNGMILTVAKAGDRISFVANKEYWRGEPYLEGIDMKPLPGEGALETRRAMFRTGQVDFAEGISPTTRDTELVLQSNPGTVALTLPLVRGTDLIGFNMKNPKWHDDRIRQALNLGLDREGFKATVGGGDGVAVLNTLPWPYAFDKLPGAAEHGKWFRFDPAEARKMLEAAGAGTLQFEFLRTTNYTTDAALSFMIENYKKLGVTITPKTQDVTTFNVSWSAQNYPDTAKGPSVGYVADTFYKDHITSGSTLNRWNISDPVVDDLAAQQSAELNPQKRRELLRKVWDRMSEKMYRIEGPGTSGSTTLYPSYLRMYRISAVGSWFSPGGDFASYAYKAWMDK